jgi:fructosamine-3-kinase
MARNPTTAQRAEAVLGVAVVATSPVAGGDICTATRLRLSDGRSALMKTRAQAPAGFFAAEARGLGWLREAGRDGGVPVPDVLAVREDCIVMPWVEPGRPTTEGAEALGRALAATHRAGAPAFGLDPASDQPQDGWIGALPMSNRPAPAWPEFFATRRVLPYVRLARDRAAMTPDEVSAVERAVDRIDALAGPDEPPARLHGDLWSGNVVWDTGGDAWLVDPAAHGGHRESDLAMIALFGLPRLHRVLDAYAEVSPLAEGWRARVPLHQLFPLLVHAAMFGGGYGARAAAAARSLTG